MASPSPSRLHVVYCFDRECNQYVLMDSSSSTGSTRRRCGMHRLQCNEAHNAYQVATSSPSHDCYIHKVAAVPMLANDGITIIGSMMMLQASREECERFVQADPFFVHQVWDSVEIRRFDEMGTPPATKLSPNRPNIVPMSPVPNHHGQGSNSASPLAPLIQHANTA